MNRPLYYLAKRRIFVLVLLCAFLRFCFFSFMMAALLVGIVASPIFYWVMLEQLLFCALECILCLKEKDILSFYVLALDFCLISLCGLFFPVTVASETLCLCFLGLSFLFWLEQESPQNKTQIKNLIFNAFLHMAFIGVLVILLLNRFNTKKLIALMWTTGYLFFARVFYTSLSFVLLLYGCFSLHLLIIREEKKNKYKTQTIAYEADHDPLTGLMNRRRTYAVLETLQHDKDTKGFDFAVCIFDIDNFKRFNETYGHSCGDYALKEFTQRILFALSGDTKLGRWGGEEFIIIFMYYNQQIPFELDEIRDKVASIPFRFEKQDFYVSATFGISSSKSLSSYEAVITDADNNLLEGKQKGKNKIKISPLF